MTGTQINALSKKDVLVVEDNPADAFLIKKRLSDADGINFNVEHVETLKAALSLLDNKVFDIILLDLNLSDSERMDTVKSVASITDAAIIVMTSLPDENLALKAIKAGIQEFLGKEKINSPELINTIKFAVERQKEKNRLHALAYRDELTGLPNSAVFFEECSKILAAHNEGQQTAMHIIEIGNLKDVVMDYGLHVGEAMLKQITNRLYGIFRSDKVFARLEGEKLGLIQQDIEHEGHVLYLARRILESMAEPIDALNHSVQFDMNIGVSLCPVHGEDSETLYHNACLALEEAIAEGAGSCKIYEA